MDAPFTLHPRLAADTAEILRWPLSRVLLMDDSRWPWLILVPQRMNMREIHDLDRDDRMRLMDEIAAAGEVLQRATRCDKVNVAMLGNMVPQLHVHIVARFDGDPAWPGPVWGFGTRLPYAPPERADRIATMAAALQERAIDGSP